MALMGSLRTGSFQTQEPMRNPWKLMLLLVLLGCGGQPDPGPAGFLNQTLHSDADLWVIWKAAQETVAHDVDLNPLQRSLWGAPADIRPETRALSRSCLTSSR